MTSAFSAIIGQNKAKEMLRRALGGGKLAHAYLFRGPVGTGKKTAALALAAALNCLKQQTPLLTPARQASDPSKTMLAEARLQVAIPTTKQQNQAAQAMLRTQADSQPNDILEACGTCSSCRKFASGNHPDFIKILPDGASIKIQQIREIKKALAFPPLEAVYRVILVAEVHTMRREAANSLLKALEEPPPGTIFILTGDEAGEILPTIISRCQIIPFFPLDLAKLTDILASQEKIDPASAATLAAMAEGSLGQARVLHQQNLLNLRREVLSVLLTLPQGAPTAAAEVLRLAEKCAQLGEYLPDFLDLLSSFFHDLTLLSAFHKNQGAAKERLPPRPLINQDLSSLLARAQEPWNFPSPGDLNKDRLGLWQGPTQDYLQPLRRAKAQLKSNCNRTLICEVLFFDLL